MAASTISTTDVVNMKLINPDEIVNDIRSLLHPWHRSYVSKQTFNENKMCYTLHQGDNVNSRTTLSDKLNQSSYLINDIMFNFTKRSIISHGMHVRCFKTERSVQAESQRNPSVSSRLKKAMGKNTMS